MTVLRSAILVPALASSLWLVKAGVNSEAVSASTGAEALAVAAVPDRRPAGIDEPKRNVKKESREQARALNDSEIMNRRMRIERILVTLDQVAEVAMEMAPERAEALEPVLVDLAEQTLDLTSEDAVQSASTDGELEQIEKTVDRLVGVVERSIEPEISL